MIEDIAKDLAATVRDSVNEAVKAAEKRMSEDYQKRIDELEAQIKAIPEPSQPLSVEDMRPLLKEMVDAIEIPKGDKGDSITIDDVRPILKEAIEGLSFDITALEKQVTDAIAAIPEVENGKDGIAPTADEVAKSMEGLFSAWALGFERKADGVLEKAVDKLRQPEDGKPGRDAIPLDDFEIQLAEDGRTVKMALKRGEDVIERSIKIPAILDRGVYKRGQSYEKGDGVSYGGSFWIAQKDAPEGVPGSSDDFRLAVKRGRDGRESVKIERQSDKVKV